MAGWLRALLLGRETLNGLLICRRQIRLGLHTVVHCIWRHDIIGYLNGSISSKFVSASFKSFTFGAECMSMWPHCSYRINLNISCWVIKKMSSKYNTLINLMTYFEFLPAEGCTCLTRRRIRVSVFAGTKREKPGPKLWRFRKSFKVGIWTFPNDYQHRWLFVTLVTNGHRPVEVYDTDRYQWQPGHHWWPMAVSSAEGRSPNTCVDSAPCWRGAASTIEQLKWFQEVLRQNA